VSASQVSRESPGRIAAQLRLAVPFYLGLHAPRVWQRFPEGQAYAARGSSPELVRALVALHRGDRRVAGGAVEVINFRCTRVTPAGSQGSFFVKEFPRLHWAHDLERRLGCSRVDRAWRAGHLLPRLGALTPRPVGGAQFRAGDGAVIEYLATEWIEGASAFPQLLNGLERQARAGALRQFARHLRRWHALGIYLRDLVKNVLVSQTETASRYWLTDLDGLHPIRWPDRRRVLHHMSQVHHWVGPLESAEAELVCAAYLGETHSPFAQRLLAALTSASTAPA